MRKALLTLAVLCLAAATLSARSIYLKGGVLTTLEDTTVETFGDDMNFCFAYRFSDGSIHMNHSKGIHTVTEYGCRDLSLDNGHTWQNNPRGGCLGINTFEGLNGEKFQIHCWLAKFQKVHTVTLSQYDDDTHTKKTVGTCQVEMPKPSSFHMHRDVARLASGKLLATAYGKVEGGKKDYCFVIESTDDGRTWKFLSVVADDPEGKTAEGPDEATLFQLKDGRVCCFYRDGGMDYLHQCFSSDEGATWTEPEAITLFKGAASPNGRVLADGTIVVISGRPNVYLLVDFTGTGKNYQKVEIYHGAGSSYASVLETAPNEILCLYDESNFGSWKSATPFSRIHASRFTLKQLADELGIPNDPLADKYDYIYRPRKLSDLTERRQVVPTYKPKDKFPNALATMEVVEIPERPHPVLRLVSHGDSTDGQWASLRANINLSGAVTAKVGCEFRLGDNAEKRPQFYMACVVGDEGDDKGYLAYVRFFLDKIDMLTEKGTQAIPFDCDTGKFNAFRLEADAKTKTASLYVEGQDKPLLTVPMGKASGSPAISIGDGSSGIYGSCDLSYFAWSYE